MRNAWETIFFLTLSILCGKGNDGNIIAAQGHGQKENMSFLFTECWLTETANTN
ncbi:hypothetical protein XENTR_v10000575 [Xenopus tropicalis]|nr:hypothetical protein XENTR_v10000575 [Xenopus tropicalis]